MLVKFFRHGTNTKGSIEYLLNNREELGTATTLRGNPTLTKNIIKNIKQKNKYKSGCLSFEEKNISSQQKQDIMNSFEDMLLAGFDKDQYNILWVEHIDKGRLELNFVIPRIDLTTSKAFNPYYAKVDQKRVDTWKDLQNIQYNFTNPNDPSKKRTFSVNKNISKHQSYNELNELLHNLVLEGSIKSRINLIEQLENSNISVTRVSKDYLSIKLPNQKKAKRFKGGIYNEHFKEFTDIGAISKETSQAIRNYATRDTLQITRELKQRLDSSISKKAIYNKSRYPRGDRESKPSKQKSYQTKSNQTAYLYPSISNWYANRQYSGLRKQNILFSKPQLDSTPKPKSDILKPIFYEDRPISNIYQTQYQIQIYKNRKIEYDSIRKSIISRDTELSKKRDKSNQSAQYSKSNIFKRFRESYSRVYKSTKPTSPSYIHQLTSKLRESISNLTDTVKQFRESIKNIGRKSFYIDDIEKEYRDL